MRSYLILRNLLYGAGGILVVAFLMPSYYSYDPREPDQDHLHRLEIKPYGAGPATVYLSQVEYDTLTVLEWVAVIYTAGTGAFLIYLSWKQKSYGEG